MRYTRNCSSQKRSKTGTSRPTVTLRGYSKQYSGRKTLLFVRVCNRSATAIAFSFSRRPVGCLFAVSPLPLARMNCVMRHAISWCRQNDRPALAAYMTPNQFEVIMSVVERAILGTAPTHNWREQAAFLKSEDGS